MPTILETLSSLLGFRKSNPNAENKDRTLKIFRLRYVQFKDLLASNAEMAKILADLEEKLSGGRLFGMTYIRGQATRAVFHTMRMAMCLNAMSGQGYPDLPLAVKRINASISEILEEKNEPPIEALTLPLSEVNRDMTDLVGGKSANLGEMAGRLGLPVPRGFAVTVHAYYLYMRRTGLNEEMQKLMRDVHVDDAQSVLEAGEGMQKLVRRTPLPAELAEALLESYDRAFAAGADTPGPEQVRVALRSSALAEDGSVSFAGQYISLLNIKRPELLDAYRDIVAGLFAPRAIMYRLHQGVPLEASAMAVTCLEMVDSLASGITFSRHPVDLLANCVLTNAVWGLGEYAVAGKIPPDSWEYSRENPPRQLKFTPGQKNVRLVANPEGGLEEQTVPDDLARAPCLSDAEAGRLAAYALRLEDHYNFPQDIEWSKSHDGRLLILQTRPMTTLAPGEDDRDSVRTPLLPGYPLLAEGGDIACKGVGSGPVVQPASQEDLTMFPEGGVLVAAHSSPNHVLAMDRAQAIVAEAGSVTGHMASLAREFKVPALLNVKNAQSLLKPGAIVTVDAFSGRVYQGEASELLHLRRERRVSLSNTPILSTLQKVCALIQPLNLTDPKAADFAPANCRTLHDVMRLAHEFSYREIFKLSDTATDMGAVAVELRIPVPFDLYVIDLDGGLDNPRGFHLVSPDMVTSVPFNGLLKGLLNADAQKREPRPVAVSGFLSVMKRQMVESPTAYGERFGDKTYAIISDKYLNFSSRVGYHYSVMDCYCGKTVNKNYITFQFKGGAADETRRRRRVRSIGIILERLGFNVEIKGDHCAAKFQKYPEEEILERLDQLGRLLQVTRQLDMLMTDENAVTAFAENFLSGIYH